MDANDEYQEALRFISEHSNIGGWYLAEFAKEVLAGEITVDEARLIHLSDKELTSGR